MNEMNENEAKTKVKEILGYVARNFSDDLGINSQEILNEKWDFLEVEE